MHTFIQNIAPHHLLTRFAGWVASCTNPAIKNWLIRDFIKRYQVDMSEAQRESVADYSCFNDFFTRHLKPEKRPITQGSNDIASPCDGCVSQIGIIQGNTLLQAKGFNFELAALLGSEKSAALFENGTFGTFYLSPKDYHRVHMPLTGKLRETTYIPGQLFSVSQRTTRTIDNLFARNERLVCLFDTKLGPMAVILVGAMLVGSIHTIWDTEIATPTVSTEHYADGLELDKGAELGYFQLGSTAIVLFGKDQMNWSADLQEDSVIRMGQLIGTTR